MIFNPLFIDSEAKQINPVGGGKANSSYLFRDIINVVQNSQTAREFNSSSILTNILNDVRGLTKTSKDANSNIDDQLNTLLQNLNISSGFRIGNGEYLDTSGVNESTVILGSAEKINKVLAETLAKLENEFDMSIQLPGNESNLSQKKDSHLQKLLGHIQNKLIAGNPVAIQINQDNSEDSFTLKIEQIDTNIVPLSSPELSNNMFSITLLHGPSINKSNFTLDKESPNYKDSSSPVEKELINKVVTELDKTGKNKLVGTLDPESSDGHKTQPLTDKPVKLENHFTQAKPTDSKITDGIIKTKVVDNAQNQQLSGKNISENKLNNSNQQVEKELINKLVTEIDKTGKNKLVGALDPESSDGHKTQPLTVKPVKQENHFTQAKPTDSKIIDGIIKTKVVDNAQNQQLSGKNISENKLNNSNQQVEKELINKLVTEIDKTGKNKLVGTFDTKFSNVQKTQPLTVKHVKLENHSTEAKLTDSKINDGIIKTKVVDNAQNQQQSGKITSENKLNTSNQQVEKELSNSFVDAIKITGKGVNPNESSTKSNTGEIKPADDKLNTKIVDNKEIQQVSEKVSAKEFSTEKELKNIVKETKSSNDIPNTNNEIITEKGIASTGNKTTNNNVKIPTYTQDPIKTNHSTDPTRIISKIDINTENIDQSLSEKNTVELKSNDATIKSELKNTETRHKESIDTNISKHTIDTTKSVEKDSKSILNEQTNVSSKDVKQTDITRKELGSKIYYELNNDNTKQEQIDIQFVKTGKVSAHQVTDNSHLSKSSFEKPEQQPVQNKETINAAPKTTESKHIKLETVVIDLNTKDVKNVDEMDHGLRKTFLHDIQQLTQAKRSSFDNLINKLAKSSYEPDSPVEHLKDSLLSSDESLFASNRKTESLKILEDVVKSDFITKSKSIQNNITETAHSQNSSEDEAGKNNKNKNSFENTVELNSKKNSSEVSSNKNSEIENNKKIDIAKTSDNPENTLNKKIVEPNENKTSHSIPTQTVTKEADPNLSTNLNTPAVKVNIKEHQQPELNKKLLNEISEMAISDKKDKVIINLEPASLGKIKIAIEIIENKINAQLKVENHAAKEMLQNQTEFLKESLSQNGLQLNSLNISLHNSENKNGKTEREKRKEGNNEKVEVKEKPSNGSSSKTMGYNTYEFIA